MGKGRLPYVFEKLYDPAPPNAINQEPPQVSSPETKLSSSSTARIAHGGIAGGSHAT